MTMTAPQPLWQLDDLTLLHGVHEALDAPTESISAACNLAAQNPRRPLLGLFHAPDEPTTILRVLLVLPRAGRPLLADLPGPRDAEALCIDEPDPPPTQRDLLLWQAVRRECAGAAAAMDALVGRLFARLLISGRPLRHYNCTFMLPLDLRLDAELETPVAQLALLTPMVSETVERYQVRHCESLLQDADSGKPAPDDDQAHFQAHEFFETSIRDQLYEEAPGPDASPPASNHHAKPTRHYRLRREVVADWRLELVDPQGTADHPLPDLITTAQVDDCSLYRYYNGLLLLALRVSLPTPAPLDDRADWWRSLLTDGADAWQQIDAAQVERWLRFTKLARVLFASFYEQAQERKVAPLRLVQASDGTRLAERAIRDEFSPIIIHLLQRFLPDLPAAELTRTTRLRQVVDDRMFCQVAYALSGPAPAAGTPEMAEFERLFSYGLYVDQRTDGYWPDQWAYDQPFTRAQLDQDTLRRWQGIGSLSGYTSASSVFMGFGWFFANVVAPIHVPYVYGRLQILALFYRATLALFDRRIAGATDALIRGGRRARPFSALRRDFIEFTNHYWFRQPTPQVQGREIATLMMDKQSLDDLYALLKDEMERADEYASAELGFWYQDQAAWAGAVALVLAVGAVGLSVADVLGGAGGHAKLGATVLASLAIAAVIWLWSRLQDTNRRD